MDDKANYKQLVLNLARHAIDLALLNDYYKRRMGEVSGFRELPETLKRLREFQPPLDKLASAMDDKEAAEALQAVVFSMTKFLC